MTGRETRRNSEEFMGILKHLHRNESGNVAIIFSIAVVPLALAAGAGIDMMRANQVRTVLQGAADAAALAGANSKSDKLPDMKKAAEAYLEANGVKTALDKIEVTQITENKEAGTVRVRIGGKLKTSFMAVAGLSTIDIDAVSEVSKGAAGPLELVLALDTTYSMSANDKIGTLKTAATSMVNAVMSGDKVKVGVVPFADYFHVGLKYKDEPWLNVPPNKTEPYESCTWDYPNKSGCTVKTTTCYADGVPYSCTNETCTSWGDPVKSNCTVTNVTYKWEGCVAARPEAYHDRIDQATVEPYPGRTWGCGAPMLAMTTKQKDVLDAIAGLYPSGDTHIPSGLIWAWNMLTPEAPLTEALSDAELKAKRGKRALVLMTDGMNTTSTYDDGNYGAHAYTKYGDGTYTDNLTASLCGKIKAEGTIVYTVLFDVTDPNIETLLRNCATQPDMSYVADDASELIAAFNKIGSSLTQLRITR